MYRPAYPDRDYTFGQMILRLRTAIGLTQTTLAEYLGVTRRAIIKWEDGSNYPTPPHLKKLIELAYKNQVFQIGNEGEEIRTLWRGSRQKNLLDEVWLHKLLASPALPPPEFRPDKQTSNIKDSHQIQALSQLKESGSSSSPFDWGEAQAIPAFYGREGELNLLTGWLRDEGCRVVSLLGMGGIGKSALAVTLMHKLSNEFDVVIWRSLRDGEKCEDLLDGFFQVLDPQLLDRAAPGLERRTGQLLEHMRNRRVLLVLDNLESLLVEGEGTGKIRPGYEGYGQLLRRIAETSHQSCLLLTSREKPADLISFEGNRSPVRALQLGRLSVGACEQLLADKEVKGTSTEKVRLVEAYTGNPLALKIVSQTIVEVFDSEIALFLEQGEVIFGEIRELLDQQILRLTNLEQSILLWLAIMREPVTFEELVAVLVRPVSRATLIEALGALRRRSLIERGQKAGSFTLQSVVLEYATLRLVNEAVTEIQQGKLVRLLEHNLVQARAKDYIRQSQERLLVAPILANLQAILGFGRPSLLDRFNVFFDELRTLDETAQGYGPANLVTLVRWLKRDLRDLDLSRLVLRDAYLQGVHIQDTNLSEATVRDCIFTETFGSILSMTLSSNGEYLVATNFAGEICVWKTVNLTLHRFWKPNNFRPNRLVLSPDNRILAVGLEQAGIELWDFNSATFLGTLDSRQNDPVMYEVAFAPDGKKLAAVTGIHIFRIWEMATGRELHILLHQEEIPVLMWSPVGTLLATGDIRGTIRLWEIPETGPAICVHALTGHSREVVGLAFAPDGLTLASASWDGTVKLWDVATGQLQQTLTGHKDRVSRLAWSPDGRTLASGGRNSDPVIWLWDVERASYRAVLLGHSGVIRGLAFTPDSANLISCGSDGTVRLWDVTSGQSIRVLESYRSNPYAMEWSPDNSRLVCSATDLTIAIYDVSGIQPPLMLEGNYAQIPAVRWSLDGRWIAASERNNSIRVWNARTGEFYYLFEPPYRSAYDSYDFKWSPDGRFLAGGTGNNGVVVWDVQQRRQRWVAHSFPVEIFSVDWHPDGIQLAGSGADSCIYIWDARDGTLLRHLSHEFNIFYYNLFWSPDGKRLGAIGGEPSDPKILVWDNQTLEQVACISGQAGQTGLFQVMCWDGGEEIIIAGDNTGKISWWDVQTGMCLRVCEAHTQLISSLVRSPDGTRLASCGNDGKIKIWDIKSGELLQIVRRDHPYERLNITGIKGLTEAQKANLRTLGAVENGLPA